MANVSASAGFVLAPVTGASISATLMFPLVTSHSAAQCRVTFVLVTSASNTADLAFVLVISANCQCSLNSGTIDQH